MCHGIKHEIDVTNIRVKFICLSFESPKSELNKPIKKLFTLITQKNIFPILSSMYSLQKMALFYVSSLFLTFDKLYIAHFINLTKIQ